MKKKIISFVICAALSVGLTCCTPQVSPDAMTSPSPTPVAAQSPTPPGETPPPTPQPLAVTQISREESGLDTVVPLDFQNATLDVRVSELLASRNITDADFADGIEISPVNADVSQNYLSLILNERFTRDIISVNGSGSDGVGASAIKIGASMDDVLKILGEPNTPPDEYGRIHFLYITRDYYLGFVGDSTVELAVLYPNLNADVPDMKTILNLLPTNDIYTANQEMVNQMWQYEPIEGGGWLAYAEAFAIEVSVFVDGSTVSVYNNYPGDLYTYTSPDESTFTIEYVNEDGIADKMQLAVRDYYDLRQQFAESAVYSPDKTYSFLRVWNYAASHYLVVRREDCGRQYIFAPYPFDLVGSDDDIYWIDDTHIGYRYTDLDGNPIPDFDVEK